MVDEVWSYLFRPHDGPVHSCNSVFVANANVHDFPTYHRTFPNQSLARPNNHGYIQRVANNSDLQALPEWVSQQGFGLWNAKGVE